MRKATAKLLKDQLMILQTSRRTQNLKKLLLHRIAGAFFFFICLWTLLPLQSLQDRRIIPQEPELEPTDNGGNHTEIQKFWINFESHLRASKPDSHRIKTNRWCNTDAQLQHSWFTGLFSTGACNDRDMIFRPGRHFIPRNDYIRLDNDSYTSLKSSHRYMAKTATSLASKLPYEKNTSGIVMVGGGKYDFLVLLSLRMLRRSGSKLPVQVFVPEEKEYNARLCEHTFPALDATCRILSDTLSLTPYAEKVSEYQYKSLAILFSSFEKVLFLDADAIVAFSPDDVFDSEPFNNTGLVVWPDLWAESASPKFFHIAGVPVPPIRRFSSDSGVILYSKVKHGSSLLLATYYNYYGPKYYYPLLSQGAHGEGDKDTYGHAAEALRMDYWDIKTPLWQIGRWLTPMKFRRVGMGQHYPVDDFSLSAGDMHRHHRKIRPWILHINNPFKMTPNTMFKWMRPAPTTFRGKRIRIFGTREDMMDSFGYDLEAAIWEQTRSVACDLNIGCDKVTEYYDAVYDTSIPI